MRNKPKRRIFSTELSTERKHVKRIPNIHKKVSSIYNKSIFDPNINNFINLIKGRNIHNSSLYWAQALREQNTSNKFISNIGVVPNVYYKHSERSFVKVQKEVKYKGNTYDIWHLIRKRIGPQHDASLVNFEANLRNYKKSNIEDHNKNKSEILKIPKTNTTVNLFKNKYNDKLRIRNISDARHLFKADLDTIHWESGLRNY